MAERLLVRRLWAAERPWRLLPLWLSLVPASALYRVALGVRTGWWRLMKQQAGPRVIAVGNLVVGGSGKTPFTLYLARRLCEMGLKAAIVGSGYRGRARRAGLPLLVSDGSRLLATPEEAGDEAVMMAKSFAGPLAVARRRIQAIALLEKVARPDVVVLDDAYQHVRLARDVNLLLVDGERGFGNGWLLPAGPMREPLGAARRADAVVLVNGQTAEPPPGLKPRLAAKFAPRPMLHAHLAPRSLVYPIEGRWQEQPLGFAGRRVLALSAVADGRRFHRMLRELEADLVAVLDYPDHHNYTLSDWRDILSAARHADLIVTTEKDLVKLERFSFTRGALCALRVGVSLDGDERTLLEMVLGSERARAVSDL